MSPSTRSFLLATAFAFCFSFAAAAQGVLQPKPGNFPPEIIIEPPFRDVVAIAPKLYSIDRENEKVRVLRAKLPGNAKVALYDQRPGLLVAVTDVHLRFRPPGKKIQDVHVPAGETRWIWEDTHAAENLSIRACEFLFIETKS